MNNFIAGFVVGILSAFGLCLMTYSQNEKQMKEECDHLKVCVVQLEFGNKNLREWVAELKNELAICNNRKK